MVTYPVKKGCRGAPVTKVGEELREFSEVREVPSGKPTKNNGKSPCLMGKSTINSQFSIANCEFTRGHSCLLQALAVRFGVPFFLPCRNRF